MTCENKQFLALHSVMSVKETASSAQKKLYLLQINARLIRRRNCL